MYRGEGACPSCIRNLPFILFVFRFAESAQRLPVPKENSRCGINVAVCQASTQSHSTLRDMRTHVGHEICDRHAPGNCLQIQLKSKLYFLPACIDVVSPRYISSSLVSESKGRLRHRKPRSIRRLATHLRRFARLS